jgi:two-component system OmpR family response regulator
MSRNERVLIVDDDSHLREIVRFALEKEGFATCQATNGKEALNVFNDQKPNLIVLDILMPEMDGTEVCKRIRKDSDIPIIFLSSKDEELDRILGLELGGDDYVTKPFSPRELVARVKTVLRRLQPREASDAPTAKPKKNYEHNNLRLNEENFKAYWSGSEIVLTVMEYGVLKALMGHVGKVYTRDELMQRAYDDNTVVSNKTIDSHIRRVRKKFKECGGDPIETVTGFGYKLSDCR